MIKEKKKIYWKLMLFAVIIGLCLTAVNINAIPTARPEGTVEITNQEMSSVTSNEKSSTDSLNQLSVEDAEEYKISTILYTGNKLGKTTEISGYRVFFYHEEFTNGSTKYHFYRIEFADPVASVEELEWHTIPELSSFIIYASDYWDLWNVTDALNQINHTTLESYYVYNTLMDAIMYDMFEEIVQNELVANNKTSYVLDSFDITLPDWTPLMTKIEFQIADTYFSYISGYDQKNSEKIFFYKNDESFIKQSMVYKGFAMPTEGTTRYMGFVKLNSNNDLINGTLSEYFLGKVNLFKFINLYSLNRREQTIELITQ